MFGIALAVLAAIGFGVTPVLARLGLVHLRSSSGAIVSLFAGALLIMSLALIFQPRHIFGLTGYALLLLAAAGIIHYVTGRFLSFTSVKLTGAARTSAIVSSQPLFATLFATTVGGETITLPIILGTLSVTVGVILVTRER